MLKYKKTAFHRAVFFIEIRVNLSTGFIRLRSMAVCRKLIFLYALDNCIKNSGKKCGYGKNDPGNMPESAKEAH